MVKWHSILSMKVRNSVENVGKKIPELTLIYIKRQHNHGRALYELLKKILDVS